MILRATVCKFGPLTERYGVGKVEREKNGVKRGVLAGLDNTHNRDYTVAYVSDPLLAVHGHVGDTHDQIEAQLKRMGLWLNSFQKIEVPRTAQNGEPTYAPGFKSVPRDKRQFDRFKQVLDNHSSCLSLSSDTSIEVQVPDIQRTLGNYGEAEASEPAEAVQSD